MSEPGATPAVSVPPEPGIVSDVRQILEAHDVVRLRELIPTSGLAVGVYGSDAYHQTSDEVADTFHALFQTAERVDVRWAPEIAVGNPCFSPGFLGELNLYVKLSPLSQDNDPYGMYTQSLMALQRDTSGTWQWVAWTLRPDDPLGPQCLHSLTP